jgi:hypothetical protein
VHGNLKVLRAGFYWGGSCDAKPDLPRKACNAGKSQVAALLQAKASLAVSASVTTPTKIRAISGSAFTDPVADTMTVLSALSMSAAKADCAANVASTTIPAGQQHGRAASPHAHWTQAPEASLSRDDNSARASA